MHILFAPSLAAADLATADLDSDTYHQRIARAAALMVVRGKGDWTYYTSYLSGASAWRSPDKTKFCLQYLPEQFEGQPNDPA